MGRIKDRKDCIFSIYDRFISLGLTCDFNLLDVPTNQRKDNGIHYLNNKMEYKENIKHIMKTKCIIDIIQSGTTGFTYRLWEAIAYDKHILSNNFEIKNSKFYDVDAMHFFNKDTDISDSFIKSIRKHVISKTKELINPYNFIMFIDDRLK